MAEQVSVDISIEEKAALRALTKLSKGIDNFEKDATKSIKKTDGAVDSFRGNIAAIATSGAIKAIASGLATLATGAFEAAASAEKINTQLQVLTGSADAASKLYQELTEFSASTPFQLQGLAEASSQLLSFGFEADTVVDRIEKIGEVAAGSNSDLQEVALIYGQVAAAGKLTGERLLQLQERAIPIGAALANSLGVAESEVKELVSSGVVGFAEFEKAFNSMSEAGGLFEGAIQKQSETINGRLSTLNDNFQILLQTIGKTFQPAILEGAGVLIEVLQDINQVVKENEEAFRSVSGFLKDYITTYATLATEAVKAETPIDNVNQKIEENLEKLQVLQSRKESLEDDKGALFGIFDDATQQSIDKVNKMLDVNDKKLQSLLQRRKELLQQQQQERQQESDQAQDGEDGIDQGRVNQEAETNKKILEERFKLQNQLDQLRVQTEQQEAERRLAEGELSLERREQEIANISNFEQQKADLVLQAELEKASKIRDAKSRQLAESAAFSKREIAISQAEAKEKQRLATLEQQTLNVRTQAARNFLNAGISLAKQGSREQKALQTAQALISTYSAANQALAAPPGPPVTFALAASVVAQGLANVARINKSSFENGGVVGGFSGATAGRDNTTANVRTGEMFLNAQQQRRLFDIASGKDQAGGRDTVIELTSIVQVDEREIARSVRNQKLEGFQV